MEKYRQLQKAKYKQEQKKKGIKKKEKTKGSSEEDSFSPLKLDRGVRKNYSNYIHKLLQKKHPNMEISKDAMEILNKFVNDSLSRIANETEKIIQNKKKIRMTSRDIEAATRLIVPYGRIQKRALRRGHNAILRYTDKNRNLKMLEKQKKNRKQKKN
ncbi:histone h2b-related [Anaeramoeba flamelloides]|uniref:Histone h2b-related n=1 Tax=Anaeramoeba flamelloides TaxID=1746091 RepID=A0AAV7ZIL3_9EUKA|nr:histone h2b-related [Anaeramoeba flamelloides]KAJ6235819.1 histone h2b-related [Anaeramoeba flamelloides]